MYAASMSIQSEAGADTERLTIITYLRRQQANPVGIAPSLHPIHHTILKQLISDLTKSKHLE